MRRSAMAKAVRAGWPVLVPLVPDPAGPLVAIDRPVCVVGSRARVHLPLPAETVSRAHGLIVNDPDDGVVYYRDLASCNGSFVNGAAVREVALRDGDRLRVGPFTFECGSGFGQAGGSLRPAARVATTARAGAGGGMYSGPEVQLHVTGAGPRVDGPVAVVDRTAVIGLREDCDVILPGPGVDPVHAVVFRRAGRWHVRDLDSTVGTFLNGRRVREAPLAPGDGIRVGDAEVRYVLGFAAEPEELARPAEPAERTPPVVASSGSPWDAFDDDVAATATDDSSAPEVPAPPEGFEPLPFAHPVAPAAGAVGPDAGLDELVQPAAVRAADPGGIGFGPGWAPPAAVPMPEAGALADPSERPAAAAIAAATPPGLVDLDVRAAEPATDASGYGTPPVVPHTPARWVDPAIVADPPAVRADDELRPIDLDDGVSPMGDVPSLHVPTGGSFVPPDERVESPTDPDPDVTLAPFEVGDRRAVEATVADVMAGYDPGPGPSELGGRAAAGTPPDVRRMSRLVGRLARDVQALQSAWRTIRHRRRGWDADAPETSDRGRPGDGSWFDHGADAARPRPTGSPADPAKGARAADA